MDDFSTPNTTNYFGVPASPANFIHPGKRPVSSMSPLILLENANQRVQQVLGAMLNLWFNENIKQAIDAPRLHSQLLPQEVLAEQGFNHVRIFYLKKPNLFSDNLFFIEYFETTETTWS
jgi:gamma-glutamyltranspeptidase/glutathione hydrolase/leukotriene-C4 hydrolase